MVHHRRSGAVHKPTPRPEVDELISAHHSIVKDTLLIERLDSDTVSTVQAYQRFSTLHCVRNDNSMWRNAMEEGWVC